MLCRYDREFLLQFELGCKEEPESLPPLDAIGLEPVDQLSLTRGGSRHSRRLSGASAPSFQASIGGGVSGTSLRSQYQSMGEFTTSSSKFGPGSERFETEGGHSVSLSGASVPFHNPPIQRTPSGLGSSIPNHQTRTKRKRTKRGEKRNEVEPEPEMEDIKMMDVTPEPEEGELPSSKNDVIEKSGGSLCINSALPARWRPGPLDLTHSRPPSSPLTLARPLEDLGSVTYPAGISSQLSLTHGGSGCSRQLSDTSAPSRQASIGGIVSGTSLRSDSERFETAGGCSVSLGGASLPFRNPPSQTAKGGFVTASHNSGVYVALVAVISLTIGADAVCYPSSETFHLSTEKLDTLTGMVDEMDRRFMREHDEMDRRFTREQDDLTRKFTREHDDLTRRFTREHDDLTRRFMREHDDLTRSIKDMEREIEHLGRTVSYQTRNKRCEKRTDSTKVGPTGLQAHGPAFGQPQAGFSLPAFVHVAPLQMSENRWDRKMLANSDPDAPEVVDRKVKALLNKLTMEKFDSISDQIIQWANRSETQKDGRTLIQVIRLVFEKATDEATWSEMYARLCRKMMEQISTNVHDVGIKTAQGKPIAGGQLIRKYLVNRCQEDFERWVAKEAAAAAAAIKAKEHQSIKDANERNGTDEVALYSEEYYIAQKAKRQGLGLIKFIGELFKLQMLTERIMHECIKKLLGNVHDPEEEEIEGLCTLITTVGLLLDTQRGRAHMDVYFQRMKGLTRNLNVSSEMQLILQVYITVECIVRILIAS
jgi:hypothetical protein